MHDQLHFAGATGDAVIISAGADGEVAFTRKPQGNRYLVSTNFNVANPSNGSYPCWRYETATERLEQLVSQEGNLTAQNAANVLEAVRGWTVESMVADLPHGIVYLYFFNQFDRPVVLNVAEEIVNARAGGPLSNLFPEDVKQEAARRLQYIQSQYSRYEVLGKVWLGLVVASLETLLIGSIKQHKGLVFWIPVVIILGPLGSLIWLASGRKRRAGNWQAILVEAVGVLSPTIVAFVTVAVGLVLIQGDPRIRDAFTLLQLTIIHWMARIPGTAADFRNKKGLLAFSLSVVPACLGGCQSGCSGYFCTGYSSGEYEPTNPFTGQGRGCLVGIRRLGRSGGNAPVSSLRGLEREPRLLGLVYPGMGGGRGHLGTLAEDMVVDSVKLRCFD